MNLLQKKSAKESFYFYLIAVLVLATGIYAGLFLYRYIHKEELSSLELRAKTIASFIPASSIENLAISEADLGNPTYQNLKEKLVEIRSFYDDTRFIYLITKKEGKIYFMVDSEEPSSEDYSPPGQEYPEASVGVIESLEKGVVVIEGPVADRWGTWISALAPIKDEFGNTFAIVGLDIDASAHTSYLYTSISFVVVATFLILFFILIIFRNRKKEEYLTELKSEFISLASHELRSPLTFMRWKLSNLLESSDLSADLRKSLSQIKEAVVRLATMSTSILETTATSFKVMDKKEFQAVDVVPSLLNAIKAVEESGAQKGISIVLDEKSLKTAIIPAESDKLELVFTNLLSNAIKYSLEKGSVEVLVVNEKDKIAIYIKDHGVGVPEGELKHIFSGFYRAKNVRNSKMTGSGFGLYMTKKIVEFLGGVIECNSKAGEGTVFIIRFPRRSPAKNL